MNLALKVGDIITIGKKPTMLVVTRVEAAVDEDYLRGGGYNVDEFDVVQLNAADTIENGDFIHTKAKSFYFDDGSMAGQGKAVKRDAVKVVGRAKVKKKVETRYYVSAGWKVK